MRTPNLNRLSLAWGVLGAAMVASAVFVLVEGRGLSFSGDELYYYAHLTAQGVEPVEAHGLEYLFAPHNGHFVLLGRLVYEFLFAVAGTHYFFFRLAEVLGVLVSVGLFFRLASRRVDPLVALAPCLVLLFFGYAYETLLWPFNLHTVYALAFGLAAILALERDDRFGDALACALLVCSVATVEVGLAFVAGVAVSVLLRTDRLRRLWIVVVPAALYAIWWLWARKFDQPAIELRNVHLIPETLTTALAAVAGSLTGLNKTGPGIEPYTTGVSPWAAVLAGAVVLGLALRVWRVARRVPAPLWLAASVVAAYWVTIALGGRPPDSSRYLMVGAILVLLVGAYAIAGFSLPTGAVVCLFAVALLAIPANLAKFYDGRRVLLNDAAATRIEDAMVELAGPNGNPGYVPGADPRVQEGGGGVATVLSDASYLQGAADRGPLGYSLREVREAPPPFRGAADATLVGALGVGLEPAAAPAHPTACPSVTEASPEKLATFELPAEGVLVGPFSNQPVAVGLQRFEREGSGVPLGELRPGQWAVLEVPPDRAPDPWRVVIDQPLYVCPRDVG